jgi:hypothetical protein
MLDEDPEIITLTDRILTQVFAMAEANKAKLRDELLPLLGLMSIEFNLMEGDFKYLLIILRDDLPLSEARKAALAFRNVSALLREVEKRFPKKFSDPVIIGEFEAIAKEADELRIERNLMIHSVWYETSDPEKPFVRIKEDEKDSEVDFDVPTVEKLVDRMNKFRNRAYDFFCENVPGFSELPATLHDSKPPGQN